MEDAYHSLEDGFFEIQSSVSQVIRGLDDLDNKSHFLEQVSATSSDQAGAKTVEVLKVGSCDHLEPIVFDWLQVNETKNHSDFFSLQLEFSELETYLQPGYRPSSPYLVLMVGNTEQSEEELRFLIGRSCSERGTIFAFYGSDFDALFKDIRREYMRESLVDETVAIDGGERVRLPRIDSKGIKAVQHGIMLNVNISKLMKVVEGLSLSLSQKKRELSGIKTVTDGELRSVSNSKSSRDSDGIRELKQRISSVGTEFETGIQNRHDELFKPNIGVLWNKYQERAEELVELKEEKQAKKTISTIDDEFIEAYLGELRMDIRSELTTDVLMIDDMLKDIRRDIQKAYNERGISSQLPQQPISLRESLDRSLDIAVRIDRPYRGESSKSGFYEYMMAIRRYQMIFWMMASSFGLSFGPGMREIMLPISIILLSVGGYFVVTGTKKERADTKEKELMRAKESLFSETKRMFNEVQRDWMSRIKDTIKMNINTLILEFEGKLKHRHEMQKADFQDKKANMQLKVKELDSREKKLSNDDRELGKLLGDLKKLQSNLRRASTQLIRNMERAR